LKLTLNTWIVIAIVLGVAFGFLVGDIFKADPGDLGAGANLLVQFVGFMKELFLRLLKMIIVPLIFFSIVSGVLSIGKGGGLGRIGFKTVCYYLGTSLIAILTGLAIVNIVRPGIGADFDFSGLTQEFEVAQKSISEFLFDFFLNLIPTNPVAAMVKPNVLQIIVFALFFGFFVTRVSEPCRGTLTRFCNGGFQVMMKIVQFVIWFAPVGIFALITKVVAEVGFEAFADLGLYALCVLLALAIHAFVTLPLILFFVARVNPLHHFAAMTKALLTAFSTSSSSATLPFTMECVEKRAGVSNRVTSFVLPLGATINMDGTALYECVAAVFIAQIYMTAGEIPPLSVGQQFLVVVTALAASIGAAGVPMAGMVMISIILTAIGLPLEGVGIILAVDRVLDMCRTTVNVWSDSCGAVVVSRLEGEKGQRKG
jgi:proton glutamate symport protein